MVVVFGHSEVIVGCVIRNGLRVQSLKMRQTLEKWTWRNTYSCSSSNRSQSEFHDLLSSDWVDTLLVPDPRSEFEDGVPEFGIWDCLLGGDDDRTIFRIWGAEILNPHGFPSPVNISRFLSFNYPRKYNFKYKYIYKYGWKYGFLLLLRSLDSNLPSMYSRLLLRPPSQVRIGAPYMQTHAVKDTQ